MLRLLLFPCQSKEKKIACTPRCALHCIYCVRKGGYDHYRESADRPIKGMGGDGSALKCNTGKGRRLVVPNSGRVLTTIFFVPSPINKRWKNGEWLRARPAYSGTRLEEV